MFLLCLLPLPFALAPPLFELEDDDEVDPMGELGGGTLMSGTMTGPPVPPVPPPLPPGNTKLRLFFCLHVVVVRGGGDGGSGGGGGTGGGG